MEKYSPIIIDSKMAEDHLNKIRTEHADILSSMVSHQAKVEQYNQQKEAERIANEEKQRVSMKEEAERQAKMKELEIKQQALSM